MPAASSAPKAPFPQKPIVCYVTDRRSLGISGQELGQHVRAAIKAGADWVQIREKDLGARELANLASAAVSSSTASAAGIKVIVNDRLDVALSTGAAGVHLGGGSLPTAEVVRWCRAGNAPRGFLIGVSCHREAEARAAQEAGADYIFFGPIFDTPSKLQFGKSQGVARLSEVCRAVEIPVVAIGGVDAGNALECLRAGAAGIAAIRLFQNPERDLRETIARLHGAA